jgi:hypothetical protein
MCTLQQVMQLPCDQHRLPVLLMFSTSSGVLASAGHAFFERQPDAMLPDWSSTHPETNQEQEQHDYALSHHLLKDYDQADYFRDNDMFAMPWNSAWGKLPVN